MAETTDVQLAPPKPASFATLISQPMPWQQAPIIRQAIVLVGLAGAVALGVSAAMWSQSPSMVPLYSQLPFEEAGKVREALNSRQVNFRIDPASGAILVSPEQVNELRMALAADGVSGRSGPVGLEMLQDDQSLTTSQFIESARYVHALETELSRSISALRNVRSARVHLAIPKESIFIRRRTPPSASIVVGMLGNRTLDEQQVAAVVQLVSSSIPSMKPDDVTVVDEAGRLYTQRGAEGGIAASSRQFEYTRRLEENYSQRIVNLLEPIVGIGKVRAQVTANLDFTRQESTSERFDPNNLTVRSEQLQENLSDSPLSDAMGIPGALTNRPPGAGATDEPEAAEPAVEGEEANATTIANQSRSTVRNYEVDKTISVTRNQTGMIQRLAIAVVIDDKPTAAQPAGEAAAEGEAGAEAAANTAAYTEEELAQIEAIVREAIGFSEDRGDSVQLINRPFQKHVVESLPDLPFYENPMLMSLAKGVLAFLGVIVVLLLVIRPILRALVPVATESDEEAEGAAGGGGRRGGVLEGELAQPVNIEWSDDGIPINPEEEKRERDYINSVNYARQLVEKDPARAANLVKTWLKEEPA